MSNYFCPDCGWEGDEPICRVCSSPAESLEVDPETGKAVDTSQESIEDDDITEDIFDEGNEDEKTRR